MDQLRGRRRGRRFADLCRIVHTLAQYADATPGPHRGWAWESRISEALGWHGFPAQSVPGGVQINGVLPASGLRHQIDASITCTDAHVIGEWKAYSALVPKNELLRFKAVTDDVYESLLDLHPRRPVFRLFGVAGSTSQELRQYAARHAITLVDRNRWPAPVLADPQLIWPAGEGPSTFDLARLAWLARPIQAGYSSLPDGSMLLERRLPHAALSAILDLQDYWSSKLWDLFDAQMGSYEQYITPFAA